MDPFMHDLHQSLNNRGHKDWKSFRNIFELHHTTLEDAITDSSASLDGADATPIIQLARIFNSDRNYLVSTLFLETQCNHIPESVSGSFIREVIQLFTYIPSDDVKIAIHEIIKISHKTSILACQEGCAELLVRCLIRVCDLVSPQSTCLSSIHADVLQTCISAKMYSYAHSFISIRSITEICPSMSPLSSADFLRFFYYSGIVHIALEEYQQALVCFDQVISTPASCISAIAIEAYKKALLVSLISQGQRYQVPVYSSQVMQGISKQSDEFSSESYLTLVQHFKDNNATEFEATLATATDQLSNDGNTGLAMLAFRAMLTHRLIALSSIYSNISLEALSRSVSRGRGEGRELPADAVLRELLRLIRIGLIRADISEGDMMVRFTASNRGAGGGAQDRVERLRKSLESSLAWSETLRAMHTNIIQTPQLVVKTAMSSLNSGSGVAREADAYED